MTTQPRRHHDRNLVQPGRHDPPRTRHRPAMTGPRPSAGRARIHRAGGGWPTPSMRPLLSLTGLSRDLLYDEIRRGNLAYVKVGRRRLITRQHLQQLLGIAS
jgi:excisionase family DNA binding protein